MLKLVRRFRQPWMPCSTEDSRAEVREDYRTGAWVGSNPPSFKGDALAWWKAYSTGQRRDACVLTLDLGKRSKSCSFSVFPRVRARAFEEGSTIHRLKGERAGEELFVGVADAARNLEILCDRDDYDRSERSDKRQKSGDRYHPYSQQGQGGGGNYRNNNNNNYSRDNNRNSGAGRDQRNRGQQSHRSANSGPGYLFEGYTHLFCKQCGVDTQESVVGAGLNEKVTLQCGRLRSSSGDCKKKHGAMTWLKEGDELVLSSLLHKHTHEAKNPKPDFAHTVCTSMIQNKPYLLPRRGKVNRAWNTHET
ncbi:hypothetical protein Tco_0874246 [Tanacetum coccineum]|uniref:Uncharacterized protein n=1 Tax=Tanacetum coccineum TaxID=301880 RepID=A0ABQ5BL24_9ASTR